MHELGHVLGLKDICIGEHGGLSRYDCSPRQANSVMNASAHLAVPTPYDVEVLCRIIRDRCASDSSANVSVARSENEWRYPAFGTFVLCGVTVMVALALGLFRTLGR